MAYNNYDNDGGGNTALVPLNDDARTSLANIESALNSSMMDQFFMMTIQKNGKPKLSINKAGLYWKADQLFRGKYSVDTEMIIGQKLRDMKEALGYAPDTKGIIIAEATITLYIDGQERRFKGIGTVTPENGKKTKHPMELAETRAEKRALAKMTGCGFGLVEEENGEEYIKGDIEDPVQKKFFATLKKQGYGERNDYIKLCNLVLKPKVITTTKTLTVAEKEKVISYLEGETITTTDYKVTEEKPIPPATKTAKKASQRGFDTKINQRQLSTIYELYKKLQWAPETQRGFLNTISKKTGISITSEEDLDYVQGQNCINYLEEKVKALPLAPPPADPEVIDGFLQAEKKPYIPELERVKVEEEAPPPDNGITDADCVVPEEVPF